MLLIGLRFMTVEKEILAFVMVEIGTDLTTVFELIWKFTQIYGWEKTLFQAMQCILPCDPAPPTLHLLQVCKPMRTKKGRKFKREACLQGCPYTRAA